MVKTYAKFVAVAVMVSSMALLGAGCAQKKVAKDEGADAAKAQPVAAAAESKPAVGAPESLAATKSDKPGLAILEGRTTGPMLPIYFDFDKSNVRADQKGRLEGNAKYLKSKAAAKVVVEGNCDERGTNEYNMALGERRAQSAKKYLVNLGVNAGNLTTISYGEEKPLNFGHDELAWSQNRRADFVEMP